MVKVEPFVYQKMTAFRERIQMVDKINEMIEVLNEGGVDPEEVRAIVTEELSNYYDKAEIDDMFENIDFSPYYTKTEVNTIVERIDGDVDAVEGDVDALEGRMDTAEGDIDNLETNKQNNLTVGQGLSLTNDEIDLSGWEVVPLAEWSNLFDLVGTTWLKAKEELVMQYVVDGSTENCIFFPKGMQVEMIYLYPSVSISNSELKIVWYYLRSLQYIINTSYTGVDMNKKSFSINKASGTNECRIMTEADTGASNLTKVETDGRLTGAGGKVRFFRRK